MSRGRRTHARSRAARPAPAPIANIGRGDLEASLVLIFPLLLAYAIGVLFVGRVNGADLVTRLLYGTLGKAPYLLVYAVAAALYLLWVRRSGRANTLRLEVVAPVVLEAAIYAFTLGGVITLLLDRLLGLSLGGPSIVGAIGAGVHEELVFRLGLFAGLAGALRRMGRVGVFVALVASSLVFAAAHHVGPYGEAYTTHAFAFRVCAGAAFGAIFWFRSLAHAVYAHVLYDLVVAAS
jgi:hypothetical protein